MICSAHTPVMIDEVLEAVEPEQCHTVVDATYGRGGHAAAIHGRLSGRARMILFDRDPEAVEHARRHWQGIGGGEIGHAPFSKMREELEVLDAFGKVDAVVFDFGVSSPQLDSGRRGFSFMRDGPLDMRMDNSCGMTALEWITTVPEKELARTLWKFGEERYSRAIAVAIKKALAHGRVRTTGDLERVIVAAVPRREKTKHPATRTFQAIRIAVNDEISEIEQGLEQALDALSPGGRLVVISFHSIEDRIVKRFFRNESRGDPFPPDFPVPSEMIRPRLARMGKPLKPSPEEIRVNPRSRSAVFRTARKVA
ncbi:MAG: 16S rRNA (cytosine(1402)-N(4))-methyltransferase RsmH [Gammaproteobacteria bacterium]|nr:16S rRNA (cytosine(1402)-N(4))-methyltransferase RsmH [Gammaproteobacteria bacterium]